MYENVDSWFVADFPYLKESKNWMIAIPSTVDEVASEKNSVKLPTAQFSGPTFYSVFLAILSTLQTYLIYVKKTANC